MSVLHLIWVKPPYQQIKNTTWHSFRQDDEGHTCLGFLKAHHDCVCLHVSSTPMLLCIPAYHLFEHWWRLLQQHPSPCRKITSDLLISGGAHTCFSQENVSRRERNCFWTEAFRCGEWFAMPSSLTPVPSYWVSDESRGWPLMDL